MNSFNYCYLRYFAYQKKYLTVVTKPLCSLTCQKVGLLDTNSRKELNVANKKYYEKGGLQSSGLQSTVPVLITNIHVKGYRYLRRHPIKVTYNEEYKQATLNDYVEEAKSQAAEFTGDDDIIESPKVEHSPQKLDSRQEKTQKTKKSPPPKHDKKEKPLETDDQWRKNEEEEEMEVEKKVLKNLNFKLYKKSPKLSSFMEAVKSSKKRMKKDIFLLEGWRLIAEALACGMKPKAILYSRSRIFLNMIPLVAKSERELAAFLNLYPLYKTPYNTFKLWSSLVTPPGIMAFFQLSSAAARCSVPREAFFPLTVVLDEIRDPNNLGSIIRTLAAAGVYKIILMKGCCDLWDLKVIRSASGALFHLHCITDVTWNTLESCLDLSSSSSVFLADACRGDKSPAEDDDTDTDDAEVRLRKRLSRGMSFGQLKELGISHSESNTFHETDEEGNKVIYNNSYEDPDHLKHFEEVDLPQLFYDQVKFYSEALEEAGRSTVLILGGETGLSNCAKKLAVEKDAVQVSIPLLNRIESLNSAVATGIIVYEMQKQFMALPKRQESEIDSKC